MKEPVCSTEVTLDVLGTAPVRIGGFSYRGTVSSKSLGRRSGAVLRRPSPEGQGGWRRRAAVPLYKQLDSSVSLRGGTSAHDVPVPRSLRDTACPSGVYELKGTFRYTVL
jgi:hypothetical protein